MRTRPGRLGRGAAVRADLHEVDPDGIVDRAHQVGHERQRPLEHRHEGQGPSRVVRADPRAELADLGRDLVLGQQDLGDVVVEAAVWFIAGSPVLTDGTGIGGAATAAARPIGVGGRVGRDDRRLGPVPIASESAATGAASAGPIGGVRASRSVGSRAAPYGDGDLPGRPGQRVGEGQLAVLEHERPEVTGVEQLDVEVGVELAQAAQLAVLLAHELLAERRHLEVELEVGQVEIG